MKYVSILLATTVLVLIICFPVQAKQPDYKGLFNLASDPRYYKYVNYKSSRTFENLLLFSIADKRPDQEKVYNEDVQYFYDEIWAEPPVKMLGKLFLKELRESHMFKSVDMDEKTPSLILEIEVTSLVGHYDDKSRVARGVVKIHSILRSTSDNRIILDKNYEEASSSLVGRFTNAYRHMLIHIGKALNEVVKGMMGDLENTLSRESRK
jgi:hypothetical protein